jgi:hypothetical protein
VPALLSNTTRKEAFACLLTAPHVVADSLSCSHVVSHIMQALLAEERRLSGLRTEASRRAELAEQQLAAKERQVEERLQAAAGGECGASMLCRQGSRAGGAGSQKRACPSAFVLMAGFLRGMLAGDAREQKQTPRQRRLSLQGDSAG